VTGQTGSGKSHYAESLFNDHVKKDECVLLIDGDNSKKFHRSPRVQRVGDIKYATIGHAFDTVIYVDNGESQKGFKLTPVQQATIRNVNVSVSG
jgi:CO dehydrogenase nickel-insertion accessory protein CooC1